MVPFARTDRPARGSRRLTLLGALAKSLGARQESALEHDLGAARDRIIAAGIA
jgi:hypothetical protein